MTNIIHKQYASEI